jgi:release factor glutamine methyltransferase
LTTTIPAPVGAAAVARVYQPQQDSRLLVQTMERTAIVAGRRVLDLCTGTGYAAIAAAELGCASVTAFDICSNAVQCSRDNALDAGVEVDVRQGSWTRAFDCAPFDVVVANPPYVPTPPVDDADVISAEAGPPWAWNAGPDGRSVLDPLCESAAKLLSEGGSLLLVQSAFAGVQQTLGALRASGLYADVIASQWISFGPVLSARAKWLEDTGRVRRGCREEELVVIRADKP